MKETRAPRAPSVADASHHNVAAQRLRRRKVNLCCTRCYEASSLANLWQLPTDRPGQPGAVVAHPAIFDNSTCQACTA